MTPTTSVVDYAARGPHEVVQELNVGKGFETFGIDDTFICKLVVPTLTNGEATTQELNEFMQYPKTLNPKLHTMWRPKTLAPGVAYPVVLWGNGTCTAPIYYEPLLAHLASHGFIVVANNWRMVADSEPLLLALSYLEAENKRPGSPLYQKIDLTRVGAGGHTQGGEAAVRASEDPRIKSVFPVETPMGPTLRKPTFFLAGGEDDIITPEMVKEAYDAFDGPAVYGLAAKVDHVSPITEAPLLQGAISAWFKSTLTNDPAAADQFAGSCRFCSTPGWTFERKQLE